MGKIDTRHMDVVEWGIRASPYKWGPLENY